MLDICRSNVKKCQSLKTSYISPYKESVKVSITLMIMKMLVMDDRTKCDE
jgi:hypothetical protein